jgi:hypothetical protein
MQDQIRFLHRKCAEKDEEIRRLKAGSSKEEDGEKLRLKRKVQYHVAHEAYLAKMVVERDLEIGKLKRTICMMEEKIKEGKRQVVSDKCGATVQPAE